MEYPVIIEQKNDVYRAVIPTLADLSAEGQSPDEAVEKVQQAAEADLAAVEHHKNRRLGTAGNPRSELPTPVFHFQITTQNGRRTDLSGCRSRSGLCRSRRYQCCREADRSTGGG